MIELGKTYKDGLGRDVRIICVDSKNGEFPIVGLVSLEDGQEFTSSFQKDGRYAYTKSANDLILPEDFTKFEIDEPVMVRNDDNGSWRRRYFAGVDGHGNPRTYGVGKTKWSSKGDYTVWLQCRRPTKEELES